LAVAQLVPLSVERFTPAPSVPAKIFVPLTARDKTLEEDFNPLLISVQLVPLFVESYAPPPLVPAKRIVPLTQRV
jgi:hypothetical protein